jgi:hypothetical protein
LTELRPLPYNSPLKVISLLSKIDPSSNRPSVTEQEAGLEKKSEDTNSQPPGTVAGDENQAL